MRRTSVFVAIGFLAGLGVGFLARSAMGTLARKNTRAADLAAIEKLHEKDIEVTLSQDAQGLIDIWTEDGVRFAPGKPPVVGKQAIGADNAKSRAEYPGLKVLSYAPEYKNIQIADGSACEWGKFELKIRLSPGGQPVSLHDETVLRVLRRQSDGSWRFAVLILNQ